MANVIDYRLDVLAGSPEEINRVEVRLKQPSAELIKCVATEFKQSENEIASYLPELVGFETVENLFYVDKSVNKARRFQNSFKRWTGIVDSHLLEVSEEYSSAIFLLEHFDMLFSYSGKKVIHAGEVVKETFDGKQRAQSLDWVLLDIFAPFVAEWDRGLEFGSLWEEWVGEVAEAIKDLRKPAENLGLTATG